MKTARLALLSLGFALLAACGTKGDLVLPGKAASDTPPAVPPPSAAPDAGAIGPDVEPVVPAEDQ